MPLAGVIAVLAAAVLVVKSGADPEPTISKGALRVTVGARPAGRPIPAGFLGLSIEYRSASYYFGTQPRRPNPLFVSLVKQLAPDQSPVIRFGGDTTDWTWWPTPGVAQPPGVKYALGPAWTRTTRAVARALDARLILGINFESGNRVIAHTEANRLLAGIGRPYIGGFELGNEPEVYGTIGWYATPQGVSVPGRPPTYGFRAYLPDYTRVSVSLPASVPLIGPASGDPEWLSGLNRYLAANPRVRLVTFHRYPLHRCFTPRRSPAYPTIRHLLSQTASTGPADSLWPAVRVAHAHGVAFRSDELNSVSCGGARRVSDTFASALWVLNTLFNMARVGVDGVNIHTFRNAIYEPFAFRHARERWTAQVKPMYYGMLLFARAMPAGSRLLPTSAARPGNLRIWATRARGGRVRVVLINSSAHGSETVAVRPPRPAARATAQRLRAPRLAAKTDITLGGQSFGSTTAIAALAGRLRERRLSAVQGSFVVRVPPASATLLNIGR